LSCSGLDNLDSIKGILNIYRNSSLESLEGFNSLESINEYLTIYRNSYLTDISALENLVSVGSSFDISYNFRLPSLRGLDNIDANSISNIHISNNFEISTCEVQSVCDFLLNNLGSATIINNNPGCNSEEEVELACETLWVQDYEVEPEISVYPNPAREKIYITIKNDLIINAVKIYNQLGQLVYNQQGITTSIDISNLSEGIYVLELAENERIHRREIVIR